MKSNQTLQVERELDRIDRRYDAENDVSLPMVTWCDKQLTDVIRCLLIEIDALEDRITNLENRR
jgi:hypothetical protein